MTPAVNRDSRRRIFLITQKAKFDHLLFEPLEKIDFLVFNLIQERR